MDIVVPIKFVPDPVEELEIDPETNLLDRTFIRLIPNELDEHALEEALLLKERHGGSVTVLAPDAPEVDETLFTAIAKGADRVIKLTGDGLEEGITNHALAAIVQSAISDLSFDLILIGTQAVDDVDGFVGALLAAGLQLPYVGYVTAVACEDGRLTATKEYPGGLTAQISVSLPAVLGIQSAEQPPRYVITSRVMEAMKSATIEERPVDDVPADCVPEISGMAVPEAGSRAEIIDGDIDHVADELVRILQERGVLTA